MMTGCCSFEYHPFNMQTDAGDRIEIEMAAEGPCGRSFNWDDRTMAIRLNGEYLGHIARKSLACEGMTSCCRDAAMYDYVIYGPDGETELYRIKAIDLWNFGRYTWNAPVVDSNGKNVGNVKVQKHHLLRDMEDVLNVMGYDSNLDYHDFVVKCGDVDRESKALLLASAMFMRQHHFWQARYIRKKPKKTRRSRY